MRRLYQLVVPAILSATLSITTATAASPVPVKELKEWTVLVFLNGHNNLDYFGSKDVNEMEQVGSTDQMNIVVQWASLANGNTKRLYVTQDSDTNKVSSVPVEEMAPVDMGDYRNLVEFIRWGAQNFPAKRYFVDVWNHGSGWHNVLNALKSGRGGISINDISNDDLTGNKITTLQLGQALTEASQAIGQRIEVYGSDACLMGMVEVASEMSDSVNYFVGSQELEPGDGWPYDRVLGEISKNPGISTRDFGKAFVQHYVDSYGGSGDLTLSMVDLRQLPKVEAAVAGLGQAINKLPKSGKKAVGRVIKETQAFYYSDYKDAGEFATKLAGYGITQFDRRAADDLKQALSDFTVANATSTSYSRSTGTSLWIPSESYQYTSHSQRYGELQFHKRTGWGDTLKSILF